MYVYIKNSSKMVDFPIVWKCFFHVHAKPMMHYTNYYVVYFNYVLSSVLHHESCNSFLFQKQTENIFTSFGLVEIFFFNLDFTLLSLISPFNIIINNNNNINNPPHITQICDILYLSLQFCLYKVLLFYYCYIIVYYFLNKMCILIVLLLYLSYYYNHLSLSLT